jgi:hypothetical protein
MSLRECEIGHPRYSALQQADREMRHPSQPRHRNSLTQGKRMRCLRLAFATRSQPSLVRTTHMQRIQYFLSKNLISHALPHS